MSGKMIGGRRQELIRALLVAKDYLAFSAEKDGFADDETYLAVRNYIEQLLKEINT